MVWWNPFSWFFSEDGMRKDLEDLAADIKLRPEKINVSEKLFLKYAAIINKNKGKIKNKKEMNKLVNNIEALIKAVRKGAIKKAVKAKVMKKAA